MAEVESAILQNQVNTQNPKGLTSISTAQPLGDITNLKDSATANIHFLSSQLQNQTSKTNNITPQENANQTKGPKMHTFTRADIDIDAEKETIPKLDTPYEVQSDPNFHYECSKYSYSIPVDTNTKFDLEEIGLFPQEEFDNTESHKG